MFSRQLFREVKIIPSLWKQAKRSAGHSKWQNIRHTKAAKDDERAGSIARKLRDIKVAIVESGGVTDVQQSPTLATAVDRALRANVPKETVDAFLHKMKGARQTTFSYRFKGPKDCIIVLTFGCIVQLQGEVRGNIRRIIQKFSYLEPTQGLTHVFEPKGVILAKLSSKKASMDDAEEAAIIAEAEEVRPEEDDLEIFRFLTDVRNLGSVTKSLKENQWEILESNIQDLPTFFVELSESELEAVKDEVSKLTDFPDFIKIVDNIA